MKKLLFLSLLAFLAFEACKKKDDPVVEPPKSTADVEMNRITKHQWTIYQLTVGGTDLWNFPGAFPSCQKDDSYRFYRDSTLMQYENSNVCSGNPDSTATSWRFYEGRKKIIGTILGLTDTVGVVSLEDSLMQLSVDYQGNPALIYFKKK